MKSKQVWMKSSAKASDEIKSASPIPALAGFHPRKWIYSDVGGFSWKRLRIVSNPESFSGGWIILLSATLLEKENFIAALDLGGVPFEVVCDVVAYCEANKPTDTDWVVLPIANFDCYYGNTNFSKKWLSKIPVDILSREVSNGVSRVKLNI